ncbi:hypothetical protein QBC36DRAFT_324770 [Triangularia setosa]|uniref:Uncharacterized protein n=1 Tax=Triangularia setosa TaxID=2587417 RepID=A0AAN7A9Q4_9PEZI|nr:hypothetical protein QBC36DRAFT_324770 [Podospora setosa]
MLEQAMQTEPGEQVPIGYAVQWFMDAGRGRNTATPKEWYYWRLRTELSEQLWITKVRSRYLCDKQRVDATDLGFWLSWLIHQWQNVDM